MIPKNISKHILTLGVAYDAPKGGVAQVIYHHARICEQFNFIATVRKGNNITKLWLAIYAYFKLLYYLLAKDIKIVHLHGASHGSFWRKHYYINLIHFFGKKIVYHIHSGEFAEFSSKHKRAVKNTLSKSDVIIALSTSWKKFLEDKFDCNNVIIIKNIIEIPCPRPFIHSTVVHFLFLGFLNKNKGIYDLLTIISRHHNELTGHFILHIGGHGETDKVLNFIRDHHLEDVVKFEGWVSGNKKQELLSLADVYIHPSYYEGLPLSVLEAMSYKLPIISTTVGGIPEIVENGINGFLVTPGDQEAIYNCMTVLINDKKLRTSMGEISYQKSTPYFPDKVEEELTQLYKNLM